MNEELLECIKNAIARGETAESAANSFISAGYNQTEVKEILETLTKPTIQFNPIASQDSSKTIMEQKIQISSPLEIPLPKKSSDKDRKIIISLSILLFLVLLGAGMIFLFREKLFG